MAADAIVLAAVVLGTGAAAAIDLRTRRIPNALTALIATSGVVLAFGGVGRIGLVASLLGLLIGLALMLPGHLLGGTGAGDVKLFAALGTLLGPGAIVYAFLYTAMAGGVLAMIVALRRRRGCRTMQRVARLVSGSASRVVVEHPSEDNRFAYAPAIAIGVLIAAFSY